MAASTRSRRAVQIVVLVLLMTVAVLAIPATRQRLLRTAGWALVADDPAQRADVIVVPEWAGPEGALEAADLVRQGISTRIAVLAGPSRPIEAEFVQRGIPYEDDAARLVRLLTSLHVATVEQIPSPAEGTEAEGALLPGWCDERHFASVVVVSSPDHARRIRRVLRRSMRGRQTSVMIRTTHSSIFDPDRWWKSRDGVRIEIVEGEKLLLDILRHPLP